MTKRNSNSTKKTSVGYGRPPIEHQFKPGHSGNPSGRRKGARDFTSDLREELAELVSIKDGDGSVQLTRQRAIVKVLVQAAVAGDQRAATTVFSLSSRASGSEPEPQPEETSDPEDQAIAEASAQRQGKRDGGGHES